MPLPGIQTFPRRGKRLASWRNTVKLKLAILLFVVLSYGPAPAAAQQIVGSAQTFGVLGSTTVTNTGATMISGNVGVSPGTSITGFPPGTLVSGTIYTGANAVVVQAQADAQTVYNALVAKPCNTNLTGTDLGGLTLTPGVYCFDGAATLTAGSATLTLNAQNGPGVFVFQIGTTLTTGTSSAVNVINGNAATGVFWQLGSSATLGTGTLFAGNIVANTSITVVSTAKILCGRALALNGAVTMDTNAISNDCTSHNFDTGRTDFGSLGFAGAHIATHDFNGDGKSDILWRNSNGSVAAWLINGGQVTQSGTIAIEASDWQIVGQRDFNGDGKADILWRNGNTGTVKLWLMNGLQAQSITVASNVPSNWVIAGVGDFNGDGMADILWRDSTTGTVAIWLMNGGRVTQSHTVGIVASNWVIAGTSPNGHILWRNNTNGALVVWVMNGFTVSQTHNLGAVASTWVVVGSGDFDGNGSEDLLFRNSSTGEVAIWFITNGAVTSTASLGTVPAAWSIDLTGDFDGNGKSDIVWTNTSTGVRVIWFMNGGTVASSARLGTVATAWGIQSMAAE